MARKVVRKNWMGKARKRMVKKGTVGSFTAYCKRKGHGGVTGECIREGLASGNKKIVKKAQFAKAARKIARRKKG